MQTRRNDSGYTISEVVVIVAIIGALASMAVPGTQKMLADQTSVDMARTVGSAFRLARVEALRTGHNHVVFFSVGGAGDTAGNPLLDANGQPAAVLILDDGPTGSPDQNCEIDPGENTRTISAESGLSWGYAQAGGTKAPGDLSPRAAASGSSFATPTGGSATWVLFKPDGTPVAIDGGCNQGMIGSGNGAIYFTNGERDQAIVVDALGGTSIHAWNHAKGQWTN